MLELELASGRMGMSTWSTLFADSPYIYQLKGQTAEGESIDNHQLTGLEVSREGEEVIATGQFERLGLALEQRIKPAGAGFEETITLRNFTNEAVVLNDIGIGFASNLTGRERWRLCAVPFRVQLDGSCHDYTTADLLAGNCHNAVYTEDSRVGVQPLTEEGRLRSEAWAWWAHDHGLLVIKYNHSDIELSVAAPLQLDHGTILRFGGVGTCLYGEPVKGHYLPANSSFTFGSTFYLPVQGCISQAFPAYRDFLDSKGHRFPKDFDPPVNWNELYDIGWHHSDQEALKHRYTLPALLEEAEKAVACGCDLLYLDPGWEIAEGTTLWDEQRLGSTEDLIKLLDEEYGLALGFRTILRCYRDHWPPEMMIQHRNLPRQKMPGFGLTFWEPCLCFREFFQQKLERILTIVRKGVKFLMVDEMDWRGPCHDPDHAHPVPTTALDHAKAVFDLCREIRKQCPHVLIECHDPVWPWFTAVYAPVYFHQGFGEQGSYQENWGFEYMWDCINDLKSGKALALYYYALSCNIPLYLHINMAADNDNCLFFWWAASTVRHLGIGGKFADPTIAPQDKAPHDPEHRFSAYRQQMRVYRRLKPYFVRGTFHGLEERIHLHTLDGEPGGVLIVFNLTEQEQLIETSISLSRLQTEQPLQVSGAKGYCDKNSFHLSLKLPPLSPAVVAIGRAAQVLQG